jgi:uncharacterized membrane protein (DUF106 family)
MTSGEKESEDNQGQPQENLKPFTKFKKYIVGAICTASCTVIGAIITAIVSFLKGKEDITILFVALAIVIIISGTLICGILYITYKFFENKERDREHNEKFRQLQEDNKNAINKIAEKDNEIAEKDKKIAKKDKKLAEKEKKLTEKEKELAEKDQKIAEKEKENTELSKKYVGEIEKNKDLLIENIKLKDETQIREIEAYGKIANDFKNADGKLDDIGVSAYEAMVNRNNNKETKHVTNVSFVEESVNKNNI